MEVLSTGKAGAACGLSRPAMGKIFDDGHVRGYRIPGSQDRRFPIEYLLMFMDENGLLACGLGSDVYKSVLLVSTDQDLAAQLRHELSRSEGFLVAAVANGFQAALLFDAGSFAVEATGKANGSCVPAAIPCLSPAISRKTLRKLSSKRTAGTPRSAQAMPQPQRFAPRIIIVDHAVDRSQSIGLCRAIKRWAKADDVSVKILAIGCPSSPVPCDSTVIDGTASRTVEAIGAKVREMLRQ